MQGEGGSETISCMITFNIDSKGEGSRIGCQLGLVIHHSAKMNPNLILWALRTIGFTKLYSEVTSDKCSLYAEEFADPKVLIKGKVSSCGQLQV